MPKLSDMYGTDDNGFAQGVASDALSPKHGSEDIWGSTFDQSARSKPTGTEQNPDAKAKGQSNGDGRAKVKTNHGDQP